MWLPRPTAWWPGLVRLWRRGDLLGLGVAISFAALVNLALLATFIWPEAIHPVYRWLLWGTVLGVWGRTIYAECQVRGDSQVASGAERATEVGGDLFGTACKEYLKGNWEDTQRLVGELLQQNPFDVEARLLWATMLRHQGQRRLAARQLRRLERFEAAEAWAWEIRHEWDALRAPEAASALDQRNTVPMGDAVAGEEPQAGTHHLRRAA